MEKKSNAVLRFVAVLIIFVMACGQGYAQRSNLTYGKIPTDLTHLYFKGDYGIVHMEFNPLPSGEVWLSIYDFTGIIFQKRFSPKSGVRYFTDIMMIYGYQEYFSLPDVYIDNDWSGIDYNEKRYKQAATAQEYKEFNDLLLSNPTIRQAVHNHQLSYQQALNELARGNTSSSSKSGSRTAAKKKAAKCSQCNGTGVNPKSNSGGSRTAWVAYYNPLYTECPYCGKISEHYHDKCPSCNVPR